MKAIKNMTPDKRLEYTHYVTFKGKEYIREEVVVPKCFCWETTPNKLEDVHTISWRSFDEDEYQENGSIEYFSGDIGWSKNNRMKKTNPVPEIEKVFKKTLGKDLIYF
jgi:hypothetical protein